jgi:hypothetical protein
MGGSVERAERRRRLGHMRHSLGPRVSLCFIANLYARCATCHNVEEMSPAQVQELTRQRGSPHTRVSKKFVGRALHISLWERTHTPFPLFQQSHFECVYGNSKRVAKRV